MSEVINNTCSELMHQLRQKFQNDSLNLVAEQLTTSNASSLADSIDSYTALYITATFACLSFVIYSIFGVIRVTDKLQLTYKKDSKLLQQVLESSKLNQMEFRTCFAG